MNFDIKNLTDNELFALADKIENEIVIRRKAEIKKKLLIMLVKL